MPRIDCPLINIRLQIRIKGRIKEVTAANNREDHKKYQLAFPQLFPLQSYMAQGKETKGKQEENQGRRLCLDPTRVGFYREADR